MKHACLLGLLALGLSPAAFAAYSLEPFESHMILSWADAVAIGDVDGDGRNDVVMTSTFDLQSDDYKVYVYLQKADGTLAPPMKFPYRAETQETGLALADLDGDHRDEIVVGHDQGITIMDWAHGRVQSRVYPTALDRAAQDVVVLDVNRDGALDVVGQSGSDGATVYMGNGHGGVSRQVAIPTVASGGNDLEAGDFNHDGFEDFAVVSGANFLPVYVYLNDGSDDLAEPLVLDPNPGFDANSGVLGRGDFNGDGRDDLVAARDDYAVSLFHQGADGTFLPPVAMSMSHWPQAMIGHDMDLDGREDLVVLYGTSVGVSLQGADGLMQETTAPTPVVTWLNSQGLAVGDINGDSCPDVVSANYAYGLVVNRGRGCKPYADLAVHLGLTTSAVTVRLDNLGDGVAATPEANIRLSIPRGSLSMGTLPAGCALTVQTARTANVVCTGATLASGTSRTIVLPIALSGYDRRAAFTAGASVNTTSAELKLQNNLANRVLRF